MTTHIVPNNTATKRTKERLREHGDTYKIVHRDHPPCFYGHEGVLVESQTTMYRMWLLTSDIDMMEK